MNSISSRGSNFSQRSIRPDLDKFREAIDNLFTQTKNPDGAITLCIAENMLAWPSIKKKIQFITGNHSIPDWVASYAPIAGAPEFREAIAQFVGGHIAGQPLEPDYFCGAAGATAIIELTAMLLGDPGDVAVFPAPAYQVYQSDIGHKAGLERYDIQYYAHGEDWPAEPAQGEYRGYHPLSIADLELARNQLGQTFRMLVLTQPDNPSGVIYSADQLRAIADWCIEQRIHLLVNEIYALSRFGDEFHSVLPLVEELRSPYLHWWYSLSKDFGISGFRVGLLYSRNEELLQAWGNIGAPHLISNHTQWIIAELLRDQDWVRSFITGNRRAITASYRIVTEQLDNVNVPYAKARGSLFVWADFSDYLPEPTEAAIQAFWEKAFAETGVLLTAPGGLGQSKVGWLRIVYSCVPAQTLTVAMRRLAEWLRRLKPTVP